MKNFLVIFLAGFLIYGCMLPDSFEPRSAEKITVPSETAAPDIYYYVDFGAVGDGITCDFDAIVRTHDAANLTGAWVMPYPDPYNPETPVKTFYIGATAKTAVVRTNTTWGLAKFIIDDTTIIKKGSAWADSWLWRVESEEKSFPFFGISGLRKNQPKIPLNFGRKLLLLITDETTRRYIRSGSSETAGEAQRDIIIVDKDGTVDQRAPVIWDFHNISSVTAFPMDEETLYVKGGRFTTIANRGNDVDPYMERGIYIIRSNTVIDDIYHDVTGEGAPTVAYYGFLRIQFCADVTLQNSTLTGRFRDAKGTYDIQAVSTINFKAVNCGQTNSITDNTRWGIFASNYSKNIIFENVSWSRVDVHRGVHNTTIRDCNLGWQGILIIGSGDLIVENTTVNGAFHYVQLRPDYGGTWDGNIYIRNGVHNLGSTAGRIIHGGNNGQWNYGYPTYMGRNIYISGLSIQNSGTSQVYLLHNIPNIAPSVLPDPEEQLYPYNLPEKIYYKNITTSNNIQIQNVISSQTYMSSYLSTNNIATTVWPAAKPVDWPESLNWNDWR